MINCEIYFSYPPFGLMYFGPKRDAELDVNAVYRIGRDGIVTRIIADMRMPNGLALSPDEKTLCVSDDVDEGYIRTYDVADDGSLSNPRMFADGLISPASLLRERRAARWSEQRR